MKPRLARKKTDAFIIVQQKPLRCGVTVVTRSFPPFDLSNDCDGLEKSCILGRKQQVPTCASGKSDVLQPGLEEEPGEGKRETDDQ